jgi:hypothetical protein
LSCQIMEHDGCHIHLVNIFVYLLHVLQGNNSATRKENNCYDKTPSNRVIAELTRTMSGVFFNVICIYLRIMEFKMIVMSDNGTRRVSHVE